ncbi:MAG TPA: EAL domain-containing protein, partial [Pseudomonadales bacterium]|nr:EAL domain-containing protein [Pseudomonadales bacterium]
GDEFALLMECCDIIQANRIAQNILKTFKQFRFYWPENLFQVGVSIGVIPIDRPNMKLEKVLKLADQACYAAKEAGRNRYILLRDEETNTLQRQTDLRWASLINEALEKNQFQLYQQKIQPIAKHPDGERYEILLRFPDPGSKRTIAPSAFLNSAERYDLLPAIDHWVVSTVLQWLEQHPEQLGKLASCSINLSGRTIGEETHAQRILDLLQASSVPAEKICFEITETAAISCSSLAACHMNAIRNLGCKFALDDFGVGLASFNYLKNLPIDILKIDGSFVLPMLDNPLDHAMVRSINEVGHIMGKQTIAEFVNSRQLLEGLTAIGIDFVQGYHIAKPIPLNGITTLN